MHRTPVFSPRPLKRACAIAALSVLLATQLGACSTASSKRAEELTRGNTVQLEQLRTCYQVVFSSETFEPARRRIPAEYSQATLEQETDPSTAKDQEIAAVLRAQPQLQACRQSFLDKLNDTPTLQTIYTLLMTLSESSLADVLQKKKSWGDHVRDIKEVWRRGALDIEDENKKVASGLPTDPKAVQARRDTADKALADYHQIEKSFGSIRRPIFTK